MNLNKRIFTLAELAEHVGGTVTDGADTVIIGVGTLATASPQQISFLTNKKYKNQLDQTQAGAVILHPDAAQLSPVPTLTVANPHAAFALIAQLYDTTPQPANGIAPTAQIASSAQLGANVSLGHNTIIEDNVVIAENTVIGANCVVGKGTKIGEQCIIYPNVTIYHDVTIGKRVMIQSQTVIGADGFGYANDKGTWLRIPQIGGVVIGDDCSIGANSCIDRGALEPTLIGKNVIIDNLVQIAHNCVIGDHSCICGSTGIAGSTKMGKHVTVAGHCAINGHISICDNVQITGYTMVTSNITESGVYSSGQPAMTNREWRKNAVRLRQIETLYERVKKLERQLSG